jgi:hypothetical protein
LLRFGAKEAQIKFDALEFGLESVQLRTIRIVVHTG